MKAEEQKILNDNETTATEESDRKPAARLSCEKCGVTMEKYAKSTGNNIGELPGNTCTCEKYKYIDISERKSHEEKLRSPIRRFCPCTE
jgi:hypothetical protein